MNIIFFLFIIFIIIYTITTVSLLNEFVVKDKDNLEMAKIKTNILGSQIPLVIFLNIFIILVYVLGLNSYFFEEYFDSFPILLPILLLILNIFSFNSLYGLLYEKYIIQGKTGVNVALITLPLWSLILSCIFVFLIMLLCISFNPIIWFFLLKDFLTGISYKIEDSFSSGYRKVINRL